MTTRPAYDSWARIFDRYWAHDFFLEPLDKLVLHEVRPPATVLDLCCGAGHLAKRLTDRGYRVTGLDVSGEMLALARRRAPACRFVQGDAREFSFDEPFELVVSTYDSMNHILDPDDLRRVFGCVRHSLRPGTPFVFDLGTERGFQSRWKEPYTVVEDDLVVVGMGDYDPRNRSAEYRITIFRKDGSWERLDASVTERYHPAEDVLDQLSGEGFGDIARASAIDLGMDESADGTFFRARAR